ncbi:hypothetical protein SAMN04488078_10395 [Antarctobacter heliothermus]|uniref:Uncharacterized protein n=1 Tax=Antarctobacter heliothermus TaxID=74033 RepID=A0A239I485_9RHOB|nr:hypothetical protein SAMN04488078_10395 [Antarctobacter heliothermus]
MSPSINCSQKSPGSNLRTTAVWPPLKMKTASFRRDAEFHNVGVLVAFTEAARHGSGHAADLTGHHGKGRFFRLTV